ncbi:MAG: hypothetical protein QNJ36_01270 [Calothrix sp. MO_167.B42]|nr:hypothetical protein [Calothrix sp. MO_167.B42]
MPKYARTRITIVIDNDVADLLKQLAAGDSIPPATYAAAIINQTIRARAQEKGLLGKPVTRGGDRKT